MKIMADENIFGKREESKRKNKRPNKNYAVKKRLPIRPVEGENVVFITKKTNFKVVKRHCWFI
jgi:hypothetical protein